MGLCGNNCHLAVAGCFGSIPDCHFVHHGSHVDNYQFQSRLAPWEPGICLASGIVQPPVNATCSIMLVSVVCVQLFDNHSVSAGNLREHNTGRANTFDSWLATIYSRVAIPGMTFMFAFRPLRKVTDSNSLFLLAHVSYIWSRGIIRPPLDGILLNFLCGDFCKLYRLSPTLVKIGVECTRRLSTVCTFDCVRCS